MTCQQTSGDMVQKKGQELLFRGLLITLELEEGVTVAAVDGGQLDSIRLLPTALYTNLLSSAVVVVMVLTVWVVGKVAVVLSLKYQKCFDWRDTFMQMESQEVGVPIRVVEALEGALLSVHSSLTARVLYR